MKKIFSALILFALIFAGCSNSDSVSEKFLLASIFNQDEQGTEYKISVKQAESRVLGVNNSYLLDYLNDIVWTVSLYPSERNTYKEARSAYFQNLKADSNGNISFKMIKKGHYSIYLFGSYTDSEEVTYSFHAEKADVDLSENSGSRIDMEVSSAQNNGDKGSYSINVEFDMEIWGKDFLGDSNLSFSLTNVSSIYDSDSITEEYISVTSSIKESKKIFTLEPNTSTSTGLAPGFYRLTVGLKEFQNGINTISLDNIPLSDSIIVINSDKTTEGTVEAYYTYSLNSLRPYYYANSNPESIGNGLYPETAGYVWNIIDTLISAPWQEDESVVVYCGDFVLDAKEYNSIVKDSAKSDSTFFSKKGSISVISSTGTYTISSYTVTVNNGKVVFADSSNTKSSLGVIKGYSFRGDSSYIGVFENNVVLETALMPFSTCYIHNPENYLDKDNPFIRISNTHEEAQATYDSNYNFLTKLNSAITGASTLKLYVYDKAKKDYYYDLSFGVAVDTDYVNSGDTAPTGTYANLYLVKRGGSLISTKDSYYDLSINATGIYDGGQKTYNKSADATFDWNDNASATIKFTANYNKDVSPSSFEWKLNGKSVGTGSTISLKYSQFVADSYNYLSCTLKYGNDEVSSVMKFSFDDTNIVAYQAFDSTNYKLKLNYYTESLDTPNNIGKSKIKEKRLEVDGNAMYGFREYNFNDGYIYVIQQIETSASILTYKLDPVTKEFESETTAFSITNKIPEQAEIKDIIKYDGFYYILIKNSNDASYYIIRSAYIAVNNESGVPDPSITSAGFQCDTNIDSFSDFALCGTNVYLIGRNSYFNTYGIYKTEISIEEDVISYTGDTTIGSSHKVAYEDDTFTLSGETGSYLYFTDMVSIGSKLYVTMSRNKSITSIGYTRSGGLAVFDVNTDGSLINCNVYGEAESTSLTKDGNTYQRYAPNGKNPANFYGIEKILAVGDSYMLLQDTGFYWDSVDSNVLYNTDRIVYFDLEDNEINTDRTRTDLRISNKNSWINSNDIVLLY